MKILITGAKGQLGSELRKCLYNGMSELGQLPGLYRGARVIAADIDELDISNFESVCGFFKINEPDIVFNCAAFSDVNECEYKKDAAFLANTIGPRNLAIASESHRAKLVHISSDYVFDGTGRSPYNEWDIKRPQNVYGYSKHLGEEYVRDFCGRYFIVRTAWLYGYAGKNFVKTVLRTGRERGSLRVVNDQCGNPTNAADLAHHLLKIAASEEYGVYHCTNNGECTWYDFAREFIRLAGFDCEVTPCTSVEYQSTAKRPGYSSLDNMMLRCTVGDEMRGWQEAIASYMTRYNKESGEMK